MLDGKCRNRGGPKHLRHSLRAVSGSQPLHHLVFFWCSFEISLSAKLVLEFERPRCNQLRGNNVMPTLSQKRDAERQRIEALEPSEHDPHSEVHGVLLSDE